MATTTKSSKSLCIGFVLDTSLDPPDGVQQYVIGLGEWLRGRGHNVHYLVGETKRRDLVNMHSLSRNISVKSNGNRTTVPLPTSRRLLRHTLNRENFDVLHVQMPYSPFMSHRLIMSADDHSAVIGTFHIVAYTWLETFGTMLLGYWLRPSLKRFNQIVSVSPAAAEFADHAFGIKTSVLPNVVDYNRFNRALPLDKYDDDILTVLYLGRLVPRKGGMLLLQAVSLLAKQAGLPKFRVVICGKGQLEAKMRRYINRHNLGGIVDLVGFISETDKPRYYASADIAVFPSSGGESFGIVLLEAMASGKAAVLAADNNGYRSVMMPRPELLFEPDDSNALSGKLRDYLLDSELRRAAQAWGAIHAKNYDVNVIGAKMLDIYDSALK